MVATAAVLAVLVLAEAGAPAENQSAGSVRAGSIRLEVGQPAPGKDGLLAVVADALEREEEAAYDGLRSALARPWLQLVEAGGDASIAVSRCLRTQSAASRSRDGSKVSITFRYRVVAGIVANGERETLESEVSAFATFAAGSGPRIPSASEDQEAFERAGRELGDKVRAWLLPRIAALRPDGSDAGFQHKARYRWLVKGDGLEVTGVEAGSPADRAGLRSGDRIRRIDGEEGTSEMDERVYTWRLEPVGTRVAMEVERGGQRRAIEFELAAVPAARRQP